MFDLVLNNFFILLLLNGAIVCTVKPSHSKNEAFKVNNLIIAALNSQNAANIVEIIDNTLELPTTTTTTTISTTSTSKSDEQTTSKALVVIKSQVWGLFNCKKYDTVDECKYVEILSIVGSILIVIFVVIILLIIYLILSRCSMFKNEVEIIPDENQGENNHTIYDNEGFIDDRKQTPTQRSKTPEILHQSDQRTSKPITNDKSTKTNFFEATENQIDENSKPYSPYIHLQKIENDKKNNGKNRENSNFDSQSALYPSPNEIKAWKLLIQQLMSNDHLRNYVLSKDRSCFNSFSELEAFIGRSPVTNDIEKVWTLFLWITHNIDYDMEIYRSGARSNQDANSVFRTGKSVCAGYSNLFHHLAEKVFRLKCITISGYAKGYGYKIGEKFTRIDHDWIAVFIDNKWQFIEATWGAGYGDDKKNFIREFQPYYFFTPPEIFIYQHYPQKDEYLFLKRKVSLEEFEKMPYYKLDFFVNELKCLTHSQSIINNVQNPFIMVFEAPENIHMTGNLVDENGMKTENRVFIQRNLRNKRHLNVEIALKSNTRTKLRLFAGERENSTYDWICDFLLLPQISLRRFSDFCKTYRFPKNIYLHEPKEKYLRIGTEYTFKVTLEAFDVALIAPQANWTHFEKSNIEENTWLARYIPTVPGALKLSAKLTQKNSYDGAYEYEITNG